MRVKEHGREERLQQRMNIRIPKLKMSLLWNELLICLNTKDRLQWQNGN